MRALVDTHCWLWALARPEALNAEAAALLSNDETEVVFSAASVWEIAIKSALGKLRLTATDESLFDVIEHQQVTRLPILHSHALRMATLPPHHRDPFDRMLIAQAQVEGLPIVTADGQFRRYKVEIIWAGRRTTRRKRETQPT